MLTAAWVAHACEAANAPGAVEVVAYERDPALDEPLQQVVDHEIAWETEVWVADAPTHLIHFNGERFLGPYD